MENSTYRTQEDRSHVVHASGQNLIESKNITMKTNKNNYGYSHTGGVSGPRQQTKDLSSIAVAASASGTNRSVDAFLNFGIVSPHETEKLTSADAPCTTVNVHSPVQLEDEVKECHRVNIRHSNTINGANSDIQRDSLGSSGLWEQGKRLEGVATETWKHGIVKDMGSRGTYVADMFNASSSSSNSAQDMLELDPSLNQEPNIHLQPTPRDPGDLEIFSEDHQKPFPERLQTIVQDSSINAIHWSADGLTIIVHPDMFPELSAHFPKFMMIPTFTNFLYHMQAYGFIRHRTTPKTNCGIRNTWQFYHPEFFRNQQQFSKTFMPLNLVMSIPSLKPTFEKTPDVDSTLNHYVTSVSPENGFQTKQTAISEVNNNVHFNQHQPSKIELDRSKPLTYFNTDVRNCLKVKVLKHGIEINYSPLCEPVEEIVSWNTHETPILGERKKLVLGAPVYLQKPSQARYTRTNRKCSSTFVTGPWSNLQPVPLYNSQILRRKSSQNQSSSRNHSKKPYARNRKRKAKNECNLLYPDQTAPMLYKPQGPPAVSAGYISILPSTHQLPKGYPRRNRPQVEMVSGDAMEVSAFEDVTTFSNENDTAPTIDFYTPQKEKHIIPSTKERRQKDKKCLQKYTSQGKSMPKTSCKTKSKYALDFVKCSNVYCPESIDNTENVPPPTGCDQAGKKMVSLLKDQKLPPKKRLIPRQSSETWKPPTGWISIAPKVNVRVNEGKIFNDIFMKPALTNKHTQRQIKTRSRKTPQPSSELVQIFPVVQDESQFQEGRPKPNESRPETFHVAAKYPVSAMDAPGSGNKTKKKVSKRKRPRLTKIKKSSMNTAEMHFEPLWLSDPVEAYGNMEYVNQVPQLAQANFFKQLAESDVLAASEALICVNTASAAACSEAPEKEQDSIHVSRSCDEEQSPPKPVDCRVADDAVIVQRCLDHLEEVLSNIMMENNCK